jgi:hypothetical protein
MDEQKEPIDARAVCVCCGESATKQSVAGPLCDNCEVVEDDWWNWYCKQHGTSLGGTNGS